MWGDTLTRRFARKVQKRPDGCWLWIGAIMQGYGLIFPGGSAKLAHRISWELHKGPIPEDLCVLHKCDIKNCVNPDHLYLGTRFDNFRDAVERKQLFTTAQTHCKRGHPLVGDNLYIPPSGKYRMCRICQKMRLHENYKGRSVRNS